MGRGERGICPSAGERRAPRIRTPDSWPHLTGPPTPGAATTCSLLLADEVGDVAGKDLLHLRCHFGLDTLSWARRGARVTGADFSERAVGQARLPEPDDARLPLLYSLKATKAA